METDALLGSPCVVDVILNLSPDVFSATTSAAPPTRTSTHDTFSRRKSSNVVFMNDAMAAYTRGKSSSVVPTMLM